MVRRIPGTPIVNTAVLYALLGVRAGGTFAACCVRGCSNSHRAAGEAFAITTSTFCVSPPRSHYRLLHLRNINVSDNTNRAHSNARRLPVNSGAQGRTRLGVAVSMSSSSLHISTLPSKRHRNTFLLPREPSAEQPARQGGAQPPSAGENGDEAAEAEVAEADEPLALVVLNMKDDGESKGLLRNLWARAALRVCADGGANRLHDSFDGDSPEERARFIPDAIVGDLDSLRPEVAAFYAERGCEVKTHEDQDHNDFEKCLIEIENRLSPARAPPAADKAGGTEIAPPAAAEAAEAAAKGSESPAVPCAATVIGLGAFGGRFDHEMAGISLLHAYTSRFGRFVLVGGGNVAFLLEPGLSHIVEPDARFEGPTVGLIPVGGACRSVTTDGLKWNLEGGSLEFGVLVSSSNCVVGKEVRVTTDAPLVWTAEFNTAEWIRAVSGDRGP